MKAFLFSFTYWYNIPPQYILVYAETEVEARNIGCKQCRFGTGVEAKPEDLKCCTFGL